MGVPSPQPFKPLRILVCEDNDVHPMFARRWLESLGHQVSLASRGGEALSLLTEQDYDLICMDVQMPGQDGFEITAAIRSLEIKKKPGQRTPILTITANVVDEIRERCLAAGMDGFVVKPLRPDDLREAIPQLIPNSASV